MKEQMMNNVLKCVILACWLGLIGCAGESPPKFHTDTGGEDDTSETDSETDTNTEANTDEDTDSVTDTGGDGDSDTDSDSEGDSDTQTDSASDTSDKCQENRMIEFDWENAEILNDSMHLRQSSFPNNIWYIFSDTMNQGVASVEFELPCADSWYVEGRAWVPDESDCNFSPNTFFYMFDTFAEQTWEFEQAEGNWAWEILGDGNGNDMTVTLREGIHFLTVRGAETCGISTDNHPALGTIRIANNPDFNGSD